MRQIREAIAFVILAICAKATNSRPFWWPSDTAEASGYCLSWRLAVEANNIRAWRTVPTQCSHHVETYMTGGQYRRDLGLIVDNICTYIDTISLSDDGFDAWILDVDDTCLSNLFYYRGKRYGYAAINYSTIYSIGSIFYMILMMISGVTRLIRQDLGRGR